MFPFAISALVLSSCTPPRVPPPPPAVEITVSERFIHLPPLPESVAKAHGDFGQHRTGLTEGLKDLERMLKRLYACPEAGISLPLSFKATKDKAEEIRFLVSVVGEERYRDLEEPFLRAWEEWQAVLIENGLAQSQGSSTPAALPTLTRERENKALQMRIKGMRKSEGAIAVESKARLDAFTVKGAKGPEMGVKRQGPIHWKSFFEMQEAAMVNEDRLITTQASVAVANQHAPSLSAAWAPLADRLNADALHLADLESVPKTVLDPELQPLRVQARIHFLERFRTALWLSNLVWARMTSNVPPAPLEELNPLSASGGRGTGSAITSTP